MEKVTVDKVLVSDNRVCGVRTNKGDIKCQVFVNCAGQVRNMEQLIINCNSY